MVARKEIRNSTAEFLIFQAEAKEQGIEVMYAEETIWCTQKAMASLFDVGVPAIIAVGYRVNSIRATQFRQWATSVLREYAFPTHI